MPGTRNSTGRIIPPRCTDVTSCVESLRDVAARRMKIGERGSEQERCWRRSTLDSWVATLEMSFKLIQRKVKTGARLYSEVFSSGRSSRASIIGARVVAPTYTETRAYIYTRMCPDHAASSVCFSVRVLLCRLWDQSSDFTWPRATDDDHCLTHAHRCKRDPFNPADLAPRGLVDLGPSFGQTGSPLPMIRRPGPVAIAVPRNWAVATAASPAART